MSRWSFASLILAGLSLAALIIMQFTVGGFTALAAVPLGLFLFFLIVAGAIEFRVILDFMTMKTTKNGMNMGAMILMFLALIGIVNFLGAKRYLTYDLTQEGIHSLSDQSKKLVSELKDGTLEFKFFYADGQERVELIKSNFRDLIQKYQDESSNVKLDFIEMNKNPDLTEQYGVKEGQGVAFLDYKGRRNRIDKLDEESITNTIVKVTRAKTHQIYIVVGHGEDEFKEDDAQGLKAFKTLLTGNQFEVHDLNLATQSKIPENVDVLAIVGPRYPFQDYEIEEIKSYLARGGKMFLALEPGRPSGFEGLFKELGVEFQNNYVYVGQKILGQLAINPNETYAFEYSSAHPATKPIKNNQPTRFRLVSGLEKMTGISPDIQFEDLVKTNADAMAFKNTKFEGEPLPGVYTFMASIKGRINNNDKDAKQFELILAGDSDFVRNQLVTAPGMNRDLVTNTFAALTGQEDIISIQPKMAGKTDMNLNSGSLNILLLLFAALPLFMLSLSIIMAVRRRNA